VANAPALALHCCCCTAVQCCLLEVSEQSVHHLDPCLTPPPSHHQRAPPLMTYRCRPLLIATFNPDEGALREHLLDRFAMVLNAEAPGERAMMELGIVITPGAATMQPCNATRHTARSPKHPHPLEVTNYHPPRTTAHAATWDERVTAIDAAVRFQDHADQVLQETAEETSALASSVVVARAFLKDVVITPQQVGWDGREGGGSACSCGISCLTS